MKITILGSGTSIPKADRGSPGFVIELGQSTVLVDPGSGSLHRMERLGLRVKNINHVVLSHFHVDHTGDLVPLFFALRNREHFRPKRLTIVGPEGLQDLYEGWLQVYGDWVRLAGGELRLLEVREDRLEMSGWQLMSLPVMHTENSLGFRFSDNTGALFAYSGDTDYCEPLLRLLKGVDAALVESSYPAAKKQSGHLTPELAGVAARKAEVARLILTHLYPACDGHDLIAEVRRSGFQGQVEVAFDGLKIEI